MNANHILYLSCNSKEKTRPFENARLPSYKSSRPYALSDPWYAVDRPLENGTILGAVRITDKMPSTPPNAPDTKNKGKT